jgi:hypothetical protein
VKSLRHNKGEAQVQNLRHTTGFFITVTMLLLMSSMNVFALKDIRKIKSLEFKGLNNISKNEILSKVDIRAADDGILIDYKSLNDALKNISLIRAYKISEDGDRLIVNIAEHEIAFLAAIKSKQRIIPVEIDGRGRILSVNRAHVYDKPMLIIPVSEMNGDRLSNRSKKIIGILNQAVTENPSLFREIIEIDLTDYPRVDIMLRGRRTRFTVHMNKDSFYTMKYMLGYLDNAKYYPWTVEHYGDRSVMK